MFKTSHWSLFLLSPCKASISVGWQKVGRGRRQSKELPFLSLYSDDPAFTSSWECWGWFSLRMQKLECASNTQIHSLDQKMETFLCAPRPLVGRRGSDFVALPSHIFFCAFTDMSMYYRQRTCFLFWFYRNRYYATQTNTQTCFCDLMIHLMWKSSHVRMCNVNLFYSVVAMKSIVWMYCSLISFPQWWAFRLFPVFQIISSSAKHHYLFGTERVRTVVVTTGFLLKIPFWECLYWLDSSKGFLNVFSQATSPFWWLGQKQQWDIWFPKCPTDK